MTDSGKTGVMILSVLASGSAFKRTCSYWHKWENQPVWFKMLLELACANIADFLH